MFKLITCKTVCLLTLLLGAIAFLCPTALAGADEASTTTNELTATTTTFAWEWDDPSTLNSYEKNDKFIKFSVKPNQDMFHGKRLEAPLLTMQMPAGNWSAEAKYTLPKRVGSSHCGLVIWDGQLQAPVNALYVGPYSSNQLRVEGSYSRLKAGHSDKLAKVSDNKGNFVVNYAEVEGWLKITKIDDEYSFYIKRSAEQDWRMLGTVKTIDRFSRVGLIAKTWGSGSLEVFFTNFKLTKLN